MMMFKSRASPLFFTLVLVSPLVSESFQEAGRVPGLFSSKDVLVRTPTSYRYTYTYRAFDSRLPSTEPSPDETSSQTNSLLMTIDNAGLSLKTKAVEMDEKVSTAATKAKKFLFLLQSCVLYSLFILYRGYRGFFVVLPAVTRHVYSKLEADVDASPFDDPADRRDLDVKPWQTRLTVSLLAGVLTASYVLRGGIRVTKKLVRTISHTTDIPGSFAAAAEEQEKNENMIMRMAGKREINGEHQHQPSAFFYPIDTKNEQESSSPTPPSFGLAP